MINTRSAESYFKSIDELGRAAVQELRQLDAKIARDQKGYLEQKMRGEITEQGYQLYVKQLNDSRKRVVQKYTDQLEHEQSCFNADIDEYMTPTGGRMRMDDIEVLRTFNLNASEFESMAKKYADNPTMGRLLDEYRRSHNIETSWRLQSAEDRKAAFSSAINSVISIMGQMDKYAPGRETSVTRSVFGYYHKLQGSDPEALPVPAAPDTAYTMLSDGTAVPNAGTTNTTVF